MREHKNYIVIPMHNHWELTNQLLKDLVQFESENIDKVIIVDDGSTDPQVEENFDAWIGSKLLPIQIERLDVNYGFVTACNFGLRQATGEVAEKRLIFLISNDVRIHGKFIEQAENILFSPKKAFVGNRLISFDSGWNNLDGVIYEYLEGYFLAATSDGWKEIDYFDTLYVPFDFEDVDISTTAKSRGFKLVSLNNPNIKHKGAGTYGYSPEREKQTLRNKENFRNKWVKK